jgi:hypothetical protein
MSMKCYEIGRRLHGYVSSIIFKIVRIEEIGFFKLLLKRIMPNAVKITEETSIHVGDSLKNLLNNALLKLVDIGARGESPSQLKFIMPFSHYYACEPDSDEAKRIAVQYKQYSSWKDITFIEAAIASQEGTAKLFITKQPGLSSLLRPNEKIVKRYYEANFFDISSTISMPIMTLAKATKKYNFQDACFLKMIPREQSLIY